MCIGKIRRSDGFGGVFIAFHRKLTPSHLTLGDNNGNELIATQLQLPKKEIIICAIYRPPTLPIGKII